MTERTLLLRTANEGRYFILATDFPSARVFDTSTSRLACVVELPPRSRASLAALGLSSVAIGRSPIASHTVSSSSTTAKAGKKLGNGHNKAKTTAAVGGAVEAVSLETRVVAVAGLSDGTVLIHDVQQDELIGHISVSETQHAIVFMAIRDGFLFCLSANNMLYVVDVSSPAAVARGVTLKIRAQADASALAVLGQEEDCDSVSTDEEGASGQFVFRLLIAGPTYALHRVELYRGSNSNSNNNSAKDVASAESGRKNACERRLAFASQGTTVDYAWLGDVQTAAGEKSVLAAVTASANEGVVRVWDMTVADVHNSAAVVGRCRRTLLCGQRIANISLLDLSRHKSTSANVGKKNGSVYVMATTFTGAVLLWDLGEQLLPRVVEPAPLQPTGVFFSAAPSARLLYAVLTRDANSTDGVRLGDNVDASPDAPAASLVTSVDAELSFLFMRGKFALPQFEFASARRLIADQDARLHGVSLPSDPHHRGNGNDDGSRKDSRAKYIKKLRKAASSMGLSTSPSLTMVDVPPSATSLALGKNKDSDTGLSDAAGNAFRVMDTVWAVNRQRLAAKALATPTESFAAAHTYQAPSLKELPVKQLTLEQRLRVLSAQVAKSAADRAAAELGEKKRNKTAGEDDAASESGEEADVEEDVASATAGVLPSLGLATVPLYQALHANDISAVMELLSVAARSPEGMRATVLSLHLPYVLQLISIISERLGITSAKATVGAASSLSAPALGKNTVGGGGGLAAVSSRSPLLLWLDTILHFRGMELYSVQLNSSSSKKNGQSNENGEESQQQNEQSKLTEEDHEPQGEFETQVPTLSPPKDFVAPVLHQYRSMCSTYDKLATLHGRLSIFNAVRPSEKNQFVNRPRKMLSSNIELARTPAALSGKLDATNTVQDDDILFPAMFTELRTSKGPHVVRVRSKLAKAKKLHQQATSDRALLKKAKRMAKEARKNKHDGGSDDDDNAPNGMSEEAAMAAALGMGNAGDDEDIDLEALEALGLGDTDDSDADGETDEEGHHTRSSSSDSGHDDNDDDEGPRKKKHARGSKRPVSDEMIADAPSDMSEDGDENAEDQDAELDSSDAGADFARESDDEVHSQILDFSDNGSSNDGSSSDDDGDSEKGSLSSSASDANEFDPTKRSVQGDSDNSNDSGSDDGDDDDDGMGEDMRELLEEVDGNDEEAKRERRKHKRVRADKH